MASCARTGPQLAPGFQSWGERCEVQVSLLQPPVRMTSPVGSTVTLEFERATLGAATVQCGVGFEKSIVSVVPRGWLKMLPCLRILPGWYITADPPLNELGMLLGSHRPVSRSSSRVSLSDPAAKIFPSGSRNMN